MNSDYGNFTLTPICIEAMMDSNSPPTGNPIGDVSGYENGG